MGKASKWMVNFLLGKKEERTKKKDVAFLEENVVANSAAIVPSSPKIRRRWSFGKSSSKEKTHKSCKSLDSITINPVVVGSIADSEKQQQQQQQQQSKALFSVAVVKTSAVERVVVAPPKLEIDEASRRGVISRVVQDLAATKIQAVFRSYLARKALCALRALVKLQALVRGHLVRKQTTATLRQMHALIAIQVRARFHRIQMAEEEQTQLVVKSQSSRYGNIPHDNGNRSFRRPLREAIDFNAYKAAQGVSKSKNGYSNHSQMKKIEHGVAAYFSGDVSFSKREHNHQYDEFSFSTAVHNTPQRYYYPKTPEIIPGRASISGRKPDYLLPLPHHDHSFLPNYMANTESSKAKVRSQSEPKQRPGPNTKVTSMDRTGVVPPVVTQTQRHSSPRSADRNQDPWFVKLYRSKRLVKESESDANSTITSHSSYYGSSAMAYEPHVTIY